MNTKKLRPKTFIVKVNLFIIQVASILFTYMVMGRSEAKAPPFDGVSWTPHNVLVSSLHPYAKNSDEYFNIYIGGADWIILEFEMLELEKFYDRLYVLDKDENVLANWDEGPEGPFLTQAFPGPHLKLHLKSDDYYERYGFRISRAYSAKNAEF
jgi:hypothetical protein